MDEEELEKLRKQKKQEIEESAAGQEEQMERRRQQVREKAKKYMTSGARSRLGNIRAARPEMASSIEAQVARLGETGRVEMIDEDQLKDILKKLQNSEGETDIRFRR